MGRIIFMYFNVHDYQQYETIRSFGGRIFTCEIVIVKSEENQSNLLNLLIY